MKSKDMKNSKRIEVVPYDETWPDRFVKLAEPIKHVLQDNCIEVYHVGSTSVPGLSAKPIIDIIAVVKNVGDTVQSLESIGYICKGEINIPFSLYFRDTHNTVHLRVYEQDSPEIELNILFRDYLRTHDDARKEYSLIKAELIKQESSHSKNVLRFTGYTLGKDQFIRSILSKAGFDKLRLMYCTHRDEWAAYHRIRKEQIFDRSNVKYDPEYPGMHKANDYHFVLYSGVQIVSIAAVEFLSAQTVALRALATDEPFKKQGYGTAMMHLIEKWIKSYGRSLIQLHADLKAESFYRKLGYVEMPFDDISMSKDVIDLGKIL